MKNFKQLVFSASLFVATVAVGQMFISVVSAQAVQDFVVNNFSAEYLLTNEDPQGKLKITENIDVDYQGQNRGILRAIPKEYKDNDLSISIQDVERDGAKEPFITYEEAGNLVLRIGEESTYITGKHTYLIRYSVENVITFNEEFDELFWDVNGDQWLQPFESVSAKVIAEATVTSPAAVCFTGTFGSTDQDCEIKSSGNGLEATTTNRLAPGETLSIVQAYAKGYFTPETWLEQNWKLLAALPIAILQVVPVYFAYKKWQRLGRDNPSRGTDIPYFGRPKQISVMQAAYVAENNLLHRHISATIIDLAIRGVLLIHEDKKGRKTTHTLTLKKDNFSSMTASERTLLTNLFSKPKVGAEVTLEDMKYKLQSTVTKLQKQLDASLKSKGYYDLSPKDAPGKLAGMLAVTIIFAIIGIVIGIVMEVFYVAIVGVIAVVIVGIFMSLMAKRSMSGEELREHMYGLKLYLGFSEKDRLAAHDAVEAPLAKNANQPEKSVEFFEKLLPFAIAMGVEKSWSKAFSDMYKEPPEWYSGNWSTFSAITLASSIGDMNTAATQSFSAPSSSGSSGFSGGGFSGGGGGGGGGGGW